MDFSVYTVIITLILLMDPFGNIPIFMSVLKQYSMTKRNKIIIREFAFAFFILLLTIFVGRFVVELLGINISVLSAIGGVLLFYVALCMLFPVLSKSHKLAAREPCIIPLAFPLLSGPTTIAMLLIYSTQFSQHTISLVVAVSVAVTVTLLLVLAGSIIYRYLGNKGMVIVERLMGVVLLILSVQMFLGGVFAFFS